MVLESCTQDSIDFFSGVIPGNSSPILTSNEHRQYLLDNLQGRLGSKPYGSRVLERVSNIGEEAREMYMRYMLSLPGDEGHRLFREGSPDLAYISDNATNHRALEKMYTGSDDPWARIPIENIHNSMAVRNRLRIVEGVFESHIRKLLAQGVEKVNILSVAAGSSRGMLEVLAKLNGDGHNRANLCLVDQSPDAIADTKKLSVELGVEETTELVETNCFRFNRYLRKDHKMDFAEIVGLLDYLPDKYVIRLLGAVREHLSENGKVIFSNIDDNSEREFTHRIVGWGDMVYRSREDLLRLAAESGFDKNRIRIIAEPLHIYNIGVAAA